MDSLIRAGTHIHGVTLSPSPNSIKKQPCYSNLHFPSNSRPNKFSIRVSSSQNNAAEGERNPIIRKIKSTAGTIILSAATALMIGKLSTLPARAESPIPVVEELKEETQSQELEITTESKLPQFLESSPEAINALKSVVEQKLDIGEDEEALAILKRIVEAQPKEVQWKFMMARVLNELGRIAESQVVFDEILREDPLCYEALLQNSLLMDQNGEGEAAVHRLEAALELALEEDKQESAREIRLIMAQLQFLQRKVVNALNSYKVLANEDPSDYRPFFCLGCIYTLLELNDEAKAQFAKCHELKPEKFEVKGYVQSPVSRSKLFSVSSDVS
ncbi:hypothetical protein C5167_050425 [Papaver somniferum]|uniref:Uncharacterized protein n=1 Tax=Papaver somniferum TaxID=3469 RepID=A0A4Y7KNN8_PAPSO|nr:protein SLOW GREEN 1, chloroplastic-like [Papaver somniferum]RZC74954.1 hypothetical protein C5167_050425 [Papaver somniferum]